MSDLSIVLGLSALAGARLAVAQGSVAIALGTLTIVRSRIAVGQGAVAVELGLMAVACTGAAILRGLTAIGRRFSSCPRRAGQAVRVTACAQPSLDVLGRLISLLSEKVSVGSGAVASLTRCVSVGAEVVSFVAGLVAPGSRAVPFATSTVTAVAGNVSPIGTPIALLGRPVTLLAFEIAILDEGGGGALVGVSSDGRRVHRVGFRHCSDGYPARRVVRQFQIGVIRPWRQIIAPQGCMATNVA